MILRDPSGARPQMTAFPAPATAPYAQNRDPSGGRAAERLLIHCARTLAGLTFAMLMIAMPVVSHAVHPGLGMLLAVGLATAVAIRMPHISVMAIITAFLFQNFFVSIMADFVRSEDDFDMIRAYNFLILAVTWVVAAVRYLLEWRSYDRTLMPYIQLSTGMMVIIGVYFLIGFAFNGIQAIIYLRNIVTPLLLFQICLTLFAAHSVRLGPMLTALSTLTVLCGFVEFAARETWLSFTNGYAYWELASGPNWATLSYDKMAAETGIVTVSLIDSFQIAFFNSPLFAEFTSTVTRLFGPNMHSISFAYALSFFFIFALFRGRWVQAFPLFILLFLCSAKGPLLMTALVVAAWTAFRLFGAGFAFLCMAAALSIYAVLGVVLGLQIGDYHVLGLMAAIFEFVRNPIGHGIGTGGNLSPLFNTIIWTEAQAAGRTPFPVESSVGVMMYQLGVFAFAIICGYMWIAWRVLRVARLTGNNLQAAIAFAVMGVAGNGIFQEEAFFAPLALALFMGFAGMILGASVRSGAESQLNRETARQ